LGYFYSQFEDQVGKNYLWARRKRNGMGEVKEENINEKKGHTIMGK